MQVQPIRHYLGFQRLAPELVHCMYPTTDYLISLEHVTKFEDYHTREVEWRREPETNTQSEGSSKFHFQTQLPPVQRRGTYPTGKDRKAATPAAGPTPILDEDWAPVYISSPTWRDVWGKNHDYTTKWPEGYQPHNEK